MSSHFQDFTILSPQPVLTTKGTPQRIFASEKMVRSAIIEAHFENSGDVWVGSDASTATKASGHRLQPGESLHLRGDVMGMQEIQHDLYNVWWDSTAANAKLVVSYFLERI